MPAVKSTDPMKAEFVNAVRAAFPDVSKVTTVTVNAAGLYRGTALRWRDGRYDTLGIVSGAKGYSWQIAMLVNDPEAVTRREYEAASRAYAAPRS